MLLLGGLLHALVEVHLRPPRTLAGDDDGLRLLEIGISEVHLRRGVLDLLLPLVVVLYLFEHDVLSLLDLHLILQFFLLLAEAADALLVLDPYRPLEDHVLQLPYLGLEDLHLSRVDLLHLSELSGALVFDLEDDLEPVVAVQPQPRVLVVEVVDLTGRRLQLVL